MQKSLLPRRSDRRPDSRLGVIAEAQQVAAGKVPGDEALAARFARRVAGPNQAAEARYT